MNKKSLSIYIATHNQKVPSAEFPYVPIQTGAALSKDTFAKIKDNTGDNISIWNPYFCELTALYWIWKNADSSVVGLMHYRRKFSLDTSQINSILESHDVIIPPAYFFRQSLYEEYRVSHIIEDLDLAICYIQRNYPEMASTFERVLSHNRLIPYNMLIAKKGFLSAYCNWLFPILFYIYQTIDLKDRTPYQKRFLGFLAERLFTLFLEYTHLGIYTCPVIIPEKSTKIGTLKYNIGNKFNKIYFQFFKNEKY